MSFDKSIFKNLKFSKRPEVSQKRWDKVESLWEADELRVDARQSVETIMMACAVCGTYPWGNPVRPWAGGPLPRGNDKSLPVHGTTDGMVWCPKILVPDPKEEDYWVNTISDDGMTIIERRKLANTTASHVRDILNWYNRTDIARNPHPYRVTFLKGKSETGCKDYLFVGVYELDADATDENVGCVWRRVYNGYSISRSEPIDKILETV